MDDPADQKDCRRQLRKPVLFRALAVFDNAKIACMIRDISKEGARVELARQAELPPIIHLIDVPNHVAYEASVVWRKPPLYGLAFIRSLPLSNPATPLFLRKLWIEHAR